MATLLQIEAKDILELQDQQLAQLLSRLLCLEASAASIPLSAIAFSSNITAKDDGSDATVRWKGAPQKTNWIPKRFSVFQAKATNMEVRKCAAELFAPARKRKKKKVGGRPAAKTWAGRIVKVAIANVLAGGGAYVIVTTQRCNEKEEKARVTAMRQALSEAKVAYARKGSIRIFGADQIATWTNQYLSAIAQVLQWRGSNQSGLQTWESVSRYEEFTQCAYVPGDSTRDSQLLQLRAYMNETGKVARISGLPGLGKTRFVLEAFRLAEQFGTDNDNPSQSPVASDRFTYVDANAFGQELVARVTDWRQHGIEGLLVVDNCPAELHGLLAKEVRHLDGRLGLITVGIDDEPTDLSGDDIWIGLKEVDNKVIEGMLKQAYPRLPADDTRFIVTELAQGFPLMATLLAKARLSSRELSLGNVVSKVLLERLLGEGVSSGSDAYNVISVCALFDSLGFRDELADQRVIAGQKLCTNISTDAFYAHASGFIRRGILAEFGRYVSVRPKPLAIRLAADWWASMAPERAREMLVGSLPEVMIKALCERVRMLDFVPAVRTMTATLCGPQGPFGQAEVLNSDLGSQLFRALVEVNPEATTQAISGAFSDWDVDRLRTVGPGRRNLVWALEKLVFWASTFGTAAKVLARLAAAENETWSNNSNGIFLGIFPAFLAGTQAPPAARLEIIDECLRSSDPAFRRLAVKALGKALETLHYSRMAGAEQQGSRAPQPEWKPKIWSDVFGYWRIALQRLTEIACAKGDPCAQLAAGEIAHQVRGLVSFGLMDELEVAIRRITETNQTWTEGLGQVKDAIRYEGTRIPAAGLTRLNSWLAFFNPTSLSDRLRLVVSIPPFEHIEEPDGQWTDVAGRDAIRLAAECSAHVDQLLPLFGQLLEGSQRQAFVFGRELVRELPHPERCISAALDGLRNATNQNPSLLGGILAGLQDKKRSLVQTTLDQVAADPKLRRVLVDLTRSVKITFKDLDRIIEGVDAGVLPPGWVIGLGYGRALESVPALRVSAFCDRLAGHKAEGAWAALDVLFMYCHGSDTLWKRCAKAFRKILNTPGMLGASGSENNLSAHSFSRAAVRLLAKNDSALAVHLAKEIVHVAGARKSRYDLDHDLAEIIAVLFDRYADVCWPVFGRTLVSKSSASFHLRHLLGRRFGDLAEGGLVARLPRRLLVGWCHSQGEKGASAIAEMIPVIERVGEGDWQLTAVAREILDLFGSSARVLSGFSVNIHSYSWSGSTVPIHKRQLKIFEGLSDHKVIEVREWAQRQAVGARLEIELETKRDAETAIGRY